MAQQANQQPLPRNRRHHDIHVNRGADNRIYAQLQWIGFYNEVPHWALGADPVVFSQHNDCFVRIPVIYGIFQRKVRQGGFRSIQNDPIHVQTEISQHIKHQVGYHVFIWWNSLYSVYAYITPDNLYRSSEPRVVSCIYPILRNTAVQEYRLCIGLMFRSDLTHGLRDFAALANGPITRGGVYNITEDIFEEQDREYMKTQMFANRPAVAIYVCSGAKLLVEDNRSYEVRWEGYEVHNRTQSFFQQGSLFIYEGEMQLKILNSRGTQGFGQIIRDFFGEQSNPLIPDRVRNDIRDTTDPQNRRYVIFLGRHHSWSETSCWRINISTNIANLFIPDGGHILAIECWERGLDEIYWRHRYERLFEAVVSKPQPHPPVSQIPYEIPPMNMIRQILGSDHFYPTAAQAQNQEPAHQRDFVVNLNDYLPLRFRFVNHFGGGFVERTYTRNAPQLPVNIQPLNMPFLMNGQLKYAYPGEMGVPVHHDYSATPGLYYIKQELYRHEQKSMPEYLWKDPIEWNQFYRGMKTGQNQYNHINQRVGVDARVYTKSHQLLGEVITHYLERIGPNVMHPDLPDQ